MDLLPTLISLGLLLAIAGYCAVQARKPKPIGQVWRIPYIPVMIACGVAILVLGAHLISLLTGSPLHNRRGLY